jgi:hypothetical protein
MKINQNTNSSSRSNKDLVQNVSRMWPVKAQTRLTSKDTSSHFYRICTVYDPSISLNDNNIQTRYNTADIHKWV